MEKSVIKYLAEFSEEAEKRYGNVVELGRFFWDADNGKLNIAEDYSWLDDLAEVLDYIQRILNNEHIHVKYVKELRRAETASRVDAEAFYMTVKEPRLWRKAGNGVAPEFVYHNTYEDEHAIYENRFIKQLIDEIIRYLTDTSTELSPSLGNLRSYFGSGLTTSGALRLSDDPVAANTDEDRVLAAGQDPVAEYFDRVETLLKKANRFKGSTLYIECAKQPPLSGNIQPTNILLQDPAYRVCYLFYKELRHMRGQDRNMTGAPFDNALLKLLFALYRNGYRCTNIAAAVTRGADGRYGCRGVVMEKENFAVGIDTYGKDEISLTVFMRWKRLGDNAEDPRYVSHISVKVSECLPDEAKEEIARYREEKIKSGYDDAYLFVFSRQPTELDGVVNLTNKGDFDNRAAEDFARSLTLLLNGAHKIFGKRCPICGAKYVEQTDAYSECGQCGGLWSLVAEYDSEKVWVKRIRH